MENDFHYSTYHFQIFPDISRGFPGLMVNGKGIINWHSDLHGAVLVARQDGDANLSGKCPSRGAVHGRIIGISIYIYKYLYIYVCIYIII